MLSSLALRASRRSPALLAPALGAPALSPPVHGFAPPLSRSFAQGPAAGGFIDDDLLAKLGSLSTQALVDGTAAPCPPPRRPL
jgi:hypothetical protein